MENLKPCYRLVAQTHGDDVVLNYGTAADIQDECLRLMEPLVRRSLSDEAAAFDTSIEREYLSRCSLCAGDELGAFCFLMEAACDCAAYRRFGKGRRRTPSVCLCRRFDELSARIDDLCTQHPYLQSIRDTDSDFQRCRRIFAAVDADCQSRNYRYLCLHK